jgi:glycosyltransferase involved in cell wall biosynthesis
MAQPLVTVITPSYNQGRFIRATIESVLSQDYPNIEYVVMDGGSTDETAEVVKDYGSRLRWISERDRGQSHAINKGFRSARGEIVSWLNSDDVILPGAVAHAVRAFAGNPAAGAVYGEGYQMDVAGKITRRFPVTVPFNLWKLIYLYDYILQQTTYFRKTALDSVGYLDEQLNWGMDWDLLIRIGKAFPLVYIPEYMGCIREYPEAKSFAGGAMRFSELAMIMRRHGNRRFPPGYIGYGLDTYGPIWCNWIRDHTPKGLTRPSREFQRILYAATRYVIDYVWWTAQGLYSDGWVAPKLHYMLGPGSGRVLIEGYVPDLGRFRRSQRLSISCNRLEVLKIDLPPGEFAFTFEVPEAATVPQSFTIRASRFYIPRLSSGTADYRRLAYQLKRLEWC